MYHRLPGYEAPECLVLSAEIEPLGAFAVQPFQRGVRTAPDVLARAEADLSKAGADELRSFMGRDEHTTVEGNGHILASDTALYQGLQKLSLNRPSSAGASHHSTAHSRDQATLLRASPESGSSEGLPVSTSSREAGAAAHSPAAAQASISQELELAEISPSLEASASQPASKAGSHRSSPSWEEKGKSICISEDSFRTPSRPSRQRRTSLTSAGSSRASSPRSAEPASSLRGSPSRRRNASVSPYTSPDVKSVTAALASKSPDAQIRALKKLKLDADLCRCLAEEDRGVHLLVSLAEPTKSWLPSFGCSDLRTTAVAALNTMARVPLARSKIGAAGGVQAIVNILSSGSAEAQSTAAKAIESMAADSSLSFQIGQAGGCAPLVRVLTSATAFHSSIASFQMTTDHDEAQANAAAALASLSATAANHDKIAKAGGIPPLGLLLSAESSALQASAAKCLCNLAADAEYAERINQSGAVELLLKMVESKDPVAQAAAAPALGAVISSERVAALAIPQLVKLMSSDLAQARTAGTASLAKLAHNSTINKVKVVGEPACMPSLVKQMQGAEIQSKLAARLEHLLDCSQDEPLLTLLEGVLGKQGVRGLAKLAQQVKVPLNNNTDLPALIAALRLGATEEQLAIAQLMSCLSSDGFGQSKILEDHFSCLVPFARFLRSESGDVRAKAAVTLANLASINTEAIRRTGCEEALVLAAKANSKARLPALRCLLNLTEDEDCLDGLVTAGCIPVLLSTLSTASQEAQRLAAATLANVAISPKLREMVVTGGGLPLLVRLLASSNVKCQGPAAAALWQLCGEREIVEELGATDAPKAAVHALQASSSSVQEHAAGLIASLAQSSRNAVALSQAGAIEHLVPLLRSRITDIQAYAADALRGIAAVDDDNRLVIAGSCIPTLIILLSSPLPEAQLSAAGCFAALAANAEVREQVGQSGAIPHLVQLLRTGKSQAKVAAATALTNLAINNSSNLKEFVRAGGVSPLKQLLGSKSSAARQAAEGALSHLAANGKPPLQSRSPKPAAAPSSSMHDIAEDPGTPTAILMKRKSWRSPSMQLDDPLPLPSSESEELEEAAEQNHAADSHHPQVHDQ